MAPLHELERAVLGGPTHLPAAVCRAAAALAPVPEAVGAYVEKVAHRAADITDADVDGLRAAGYTEDAIFELTVATAMGAGMRRFRAGMAALAGEEAGAQAPEVGA